MRLRSLNLSTLLVLLQCWNFSPRDQEDPASQERATQSKRAQPNTRTQRAASKGGAPKPSRHQEKPSEYIKDWKVYEPQRVPWHGREFKGREFKGCLQHQILESRALPMATERVC